MSIPKHIALTPDGNRRWAKQQGLKPWDGHEKGIENFKKFLEWCYDLGVEHVTAYSMSRENLGKRNRAEISFLFKLYEKYLRQVMDSKLVHDKQVKVLFAGDTSVFPDNIQQLLDEIREKTSNYKKRTVTLCMNYSGRAEIITAIKKLDEKSIKKLDEENFSKLLYNPEIPDPDLIIRTAEKRISNFLLWQSAYSEIYFSDKFFPDFKKQDLMKAIEQYNQTERKYGK